MARFTLIAALLVAVACSTASGRLLQQSTDTSSVVTEGKDFAGFTFTTNVTSHALLTIDACAIEKVCPRFEISCALLPPQPSANSRRRVSCHAVLHFHRVPLRHRLHFHQVPLRHNDLTPGRITQASDAGEFAEALSIYTTGRHGLKSDGTLRTLKAVSIAVYNTSYDATYAVYTAFNGNNSRWIDAQIQAAAAKQAPFDIADVAAQVLKKSAGIHVLLKYVMHELDSIPNALKTKNTSEHSPEMCHPLRCFLPSCCHS